VTAVEHHRHRHHARKGKLMAQTIGTTLRPLHDRVLLKRLEEGDEKRGSIIIPDTDRILFGKYSGSEVQLNGEDYLIMKEDDVLGILGA
jgi:chaperonin GroES